jgi:glucosamine-6-phosphate deaminase
MAIFRVSVHADRPSLGRAVAHLASQALLDACSRQGSGTLVIATGSSQFEVLRELSRMAEIPWDAVTVFHLDEYVGLGPDHPASFRRFLHERFIDRLPIPPAAFHEIDGLADPAVECRRLASLVPNVDFDVAMIGIGENGHLAFNDPPADFAAIEPYRVVTLDMRCRQQQVGEGWFPSLGDVPTRAISMSVQRIFASRMILCSVPDRRKAEAVQAAVEGPVTPSVPASILQRHQQCYLHLDQEAASLLRPSEAPTNEGKHATARPPA